MELIVKNREKFGKAVKTLRKQGLIPAELYGHGIKNMHLAVPTKDFNKVYKKAGANTVVNLVVDQVSPDSTEKRPASPPLRGESRPLGGSSLKVQALIYDVIKDYITEEVSHIDFYQVRMDEEIKAKIPLEFINESAAVKEKGGILNKSMAEIEVEALPGNLPHNFKIDLAGLDDLNKSIYVKDIRVPNGVKILVDPETVIVTVTPPMKEEEKVVETPVDVSAVKVETEEKKAERAAEKTKEAAE